MKIEAVEIIETSIPLRKAYKLSRRYGYLRETKPVLVKVMTEDGLTGYGETDPMGKFTGETPETVSAVLKEDLAPAVIGEDPSNVNRITEILEFTVRDNHMAKGAVDMACYDLLGKAAGLPVHSILGGALYDELPIMGSIGGGTIEETVRAARDVESAGYHSLMVKVGGDPIQDAERVLAVRDALGGDFPLILDANQGWDLPSATKFINVAKKASPILFEQPLDAENLEGLAEFRRKCEIPISVDESLLSYRHAQEVIRLGAADVFSIKVCKNGGIRHSLEIIELARSKGITILFNSMIEEGITQAASLNIALTVPNLFEYGHAFFSPLRLDADITNYTTLLQGGKVRAPEAPGLGVELLEDVLDPYVTSRKTIKRKK